MLNEQLLTAKQALLQGRMTEAYELLEILLPAFEQAQQYAQYVECYAHIATIHYNEGRYEESFTMANLYESLCSRYRITPVSEHYEPLIGAQYYIQHEYEAALPYFLRAATSAKANDAQSFYTSNCKMAVTCYMKLAQLEEATALTHEVMAYLQTADVEILEYVEWHILQMAIAIEINDEQAVMRLRDIIAHLLPLLPVEYRRTRSYYEETIIAYYVRTGQVEATCQQYAQYIAYLQQVDVPEPHVRHVYEQWVDVAEREAVLHLEALQQYSTYLETCLSQKLEAEMATKTDSLTALIHKDTLTGSYTRHYLEQQGARFVAEGAVSVAVFDCDRFKRLNDTYGHVMGDTVLRIIATTLEAVMPPDSFLARYGGDEFVIVTKRRATDLITLFQAVQGQVVEEAPHLCISISMGIVESMPHETFSDIFVRADAALYEAKRQGRGRYVIA